MVTARIRSRTVWKLRPLVPPILQQPKSMLRPSSARRTIKTDLAACLKTGLLRWWVERRMEQLTCIINYSLHPLHVLVKDTNKRAGLKKAVEDYILEHGLVKHCSGKCKSGSRPSAHDSCQCVCQASKEVTRQCCPKEKGLARLTVTIKYARGLYGDTMSQTDGFVKVYLGNEYKQTGVIYNNDKPRWNAVFDFGTFKLSPASELKIYVYDDDRTWFKTSYELLGKCIRHIKAGSYNDEMCPLNHGNLFYSYMVECFPGLGGPTCGEYIPSPMNSDLSDIYASRNALNMTQDLLAHIRMGRPPVDPLAFMMKQKANYHPRLSALN
uniref:C2 domain-containing protein n=1 Tax=Esox lucius TaxID=8010 RepID=A0AAY5KJU3_ESOLU